MVYEPKRRRKRITSKRRSLTLEQLEDRSLFAVSPSPPFTTPPPPEMGSLAGLTNQWTPLVYAGPDSTIAIGGNLAFLSGEAISNTSQGLSIVWSVVSGPGMVTFADSHSEVTTATFSAPGVYELQLTVTNQFASASDRVRITNSNNEEVLAINSPLSLAEGATGTITASLLLTSDVDHTPTQLTYTITGGPNGGTLRRSGSATASFTQADINAGLITYQHNGSETTSDSFSFTVNDGLGTATAGTFNIVVTPVNDEQSVSTNAPLSLAEGATGTITSGLLLTTDSDNTPAQLTYTITAGPTRGTLLRSGSATASFTQADINVG